MSNSLRTYIESFVPLTEPEFNLILSHFTEKKFRKHQLIVQEGNLFSDYLFIVRGLTKSYFIDENGREFILDLSMDNNWITDMQAFHLQEKTMLNIYCLEDCEMLAITLQKMEKLCSVLDKMQFFFRQKSIEEVIQLQKRILCFISNSAANRYHELVSKNPDLVQRVPKKLIASYLGVSRETLSRLLPQ